MRLWPLALILMLAGGCHPAPPPTAPPSSAPTPAPSPVSPAPARAQLHLRELTEEGDRPARPEVSPLPPDQVEALLKALPPLPHMATPRTSLRSPPTPPPEVVRQATLGASSAPTPPLPSGPLQVLRHSPEGSVDGAEQISISFSQPMVALGNESAPAVKLTPTVPGRWRWVGTQTLLFEPEHERFPMATVYKVEVPPELAALSGARLAKAVAWSFSTPPPKLEESTPRGSGQELTPNLWLRFNQKMDPEAVLKSLTLRGRGKSYPVRLLTAAEVALDEDLRWRSDQAEAGTWVALRPSQALPKATEIELELARGLGSTEGPQVAPRPQAGGFRTYGPLKVIQADRDLWFCFNNVLDPTSLDVKAVRVRPPLPDLQARVEGNTLYLSGQTRVGTYAVTLPASLRDRFGQSYGAHPPIAVSVPSPEPELSFTQGDRQTLEPSRSRVQVQSSGLSSYRAEIYRVSPEQFQTDQRGPLLRSLTVKVASGYSQIDLPRGQFEVVIRWGKLAAKARVQVTDLFLDAWQDRSRLLAWVTRLGDGQPVAGAEVSYPHDHSLSDAQGLVHLPSTRSEFLVLRRGKDVATFPMASRPEEGRLRWYVENDRGLYRPGESVAVKGWVRQRPDLTLPHPGRLSYRLRDSQNRVLGRGEAPLSGRGGFQLLLPLPARAHTGTAELELTLNGERNTHRFEIEEFRRREFEVNLEADPHPLVVGNSTRVTLRAQTYSGGAAGGAAVRWQAQLRPVPFTPPGWEGYQFGGPPPERRRPDSWRLRGSTDNQGLDLLELGVDSLPPYPSQITLQAEVQDLNHQSQDDSIQLTALPSSQCLGLQSSQTWQSRNQPCLVRVVVTDPEGKVVEGRPVTLHWRQGDKELSNTSLTSGREPLTASFQPKAEGELELVARIEDPQGRAFESRTSGWVGEESGQDRASSLEVKTDKASYQVGETAKLHVHTRLQKPQGLLVLGHDGLLRARPFSFKDGQAELEIPITEAGVPQLSASVAVRGRLKGWPKLASEEVALKVSTSTRKLKVEVRPESDVLAPGQSTALQVKVVDAQGRPAPSELWAVVVDEAGLALGSHQLVDPLEVFYQPQELGVQMYGVNHHYRWDIGDDDTQIYIGGNYAHSNYQPYFADSYGFNVSGKVLPGAVSGLVLPGAAAYNPGSISTVPGVPFSTVTYYGYTGQRIRVSPHSPTPPHLRHRFTPLALAATVTTDAQGQARIPLKLPDDLTRYRVVVLAASGVNQFGKGESNLTACQPLSLRLAAPRFAHYGDRFQLKAVLANQSSHPMKVRVAVRGAADQLTPQGVELELKADQRGEVDFPVTILHPGTAFFQASATGPSCSDEAQAQLPVLHPATARAQATYGQLDHGAVRQRVQRPAGSLPDYGQLEVTLSAGQAGQLGEALRYLVDCPYEDGATLASRVLALSTPLARRLLPVEPRLKRDLQRLKTLQDDSGGFSYWPSGRTDRYLSLLVGQALARAPLVDPQMLHGLKEYLRSFSTPGYSDEERLSLQAYCLAVRRALGDPQPDPARELARQPKLPLEALGWLLPTLGPQPALLTRLRNAVSESAGSAVFVTGSRYEHGHLLLASEARANAVLLDALEQVEPGTELDAKLLRGLLGSRQQGHWDNTVETALAIVALDRGLADEGRPDLVARLWAGGGYLEQGFSGYQAPPVQVTTRLADEDLVISREGSGRLYYRLGLRYAPADLQVKPDDQGFAVARVYQAVDDNRDVQRAPDGSWQVRLGALVRVQVTMVARLPRFHVALVDPLPAGLEVVNPALPGATTRPDAAEPSWWFDHHDLRDDRVEAFAGQLSEGVYRYTYLARATTAGQFQVPPARAEEMYRPEVSGGSGSDRVVVEQR